MDENKIEVDYEGYDMDDDYDDDIHGAVEDDYTATSNETTNEDYPSYDEEDIDAEGDSLETIVTKIKEYASEKDIDNVTLRQIFFEEHMRGLSKKYGSHFEDILLSSSEEDEGYNKLLIKLYPAMSSHLSKAHNQSNRDTLIKLLIEALNLLKEGVSNASTQKTQEEDDDPDVDMMEVRSIVNDIMNVYDRLYAPCFVNRPLGILTAEGVVTLDKNGSKRIVKSGLNYAKRIYSALSLVSKGYIPEITSKEDINSSFLGSDGSLQETYSPMYHLNNMYGIKHDGTQEKNWFTFRTYLQQRVTKKVSNVLSKVDGDTIKVQMSLKELFTNCVIIDSLDRVKSLSIRMRLGVEIGSFGNHLLKNSNKIFSTDTGLLVSEEEDNLKVQSILYVFDEMAYKNEILFAYKAQEKLMQSGLKPSARNVVLGRGLNGKDITENFDDAGNVITGIIAGSRSGKGVVTLNILASLYADNCPVFYLDHKPDMAATLWEIEKDLNSKGHNAKIFSIDSLADKRDDGGVMVRPNRPFNYGLNAPDFLPLDTKDKAIIPYLKTMQFAVLLAQLRSNGDLDKEHKMFFILDEAQKANSRFAIALKKMIDLEARTKPKKGEEDSEEFKYASKFVQVFQHDLKDGMNGIMNTTGGQGRVGLIILGQKADPAEWRLGEVGDWRKGVFGNLAANMNIKLIGRDSGNSPMYGMPTKKFRGSEFKDDRGYFVRYRGAKTPEDSNSVEMIKTYLVLNKNDFNPEEYSQGVINKSSFTGSLLNNINDDTTRNNVVTGDLLDQNGSVRESVGFGGLMKLIMGNSNEAELASKMSNSYRIIEDVFVKMGLSQQYSCVEEYLYDCSYTSIFSISELEDMYNGNQATGVEGSEEESDDVDWFSSEEETSNQQTESSQPTPIPVPIPTPNGSNQEESFDPLGDEQDDAPFDPLADEPSTGEYETPSEHYQEVHSVPNPTPTPQPVSQPINTYQSPNEQMHYSDVYNEPLTVPQNPFRVYRRQDKPLSAINAIRMMSEFIMQDLTRVFGDVSRITSLEITESGLVVNDIAYRPQFDQELLDSMPYDIRNQAVRGNVVELFYFGNLLKFKNLVVLRIDNSRLAEGRVRRELGLSPKKTWYHLFKKFRELQELYIGGVRISDEDSAQGYEDDGRGGYTLTEKVREKFNLPTSSVSNSSMEKVWNSRPVKVFGGALGATLGIKAVTVAASMFGPWGLLFGAFAGYGAYKEIKKKRNSE